MRTVANALDLWRSGAPRAALDEALTLCAQTPASVELLNLIAELHVALHEPVAAVDYLRRVTSLVPADAAARRRLAQAEFSAGLASESIASYGRAIELEPANVRAHNNLGRVYERIGDLQAAADCYRRALAIDDGYAIAHNNLGNVLQGKPEESLARYRRAVELQGDFAEAWLNCAKTLLKLARAAEALPCCEKAAALKPELAECWFLRGEALNALGWEEEAKKSAERALALRADYPEALYARANSLRSLGDHRGAVAGFRQALRLSPDYSPARIGAVIAEIPVLPRTQAEAAASCEDFESALIELQADLQRHPCNDASALVGAAQPFYLAYQERDNRRLLERHGRLCADLMATWQQGAGLTHDHRRRAASSKPRIAFVSAQIANHSVFNAITRGWLRHLDRRRFEVDVFDLGNKPDAETLRARADADHYEQGPRSLREWAAAVIERRPDILVYPEVGMDQTTLQLASMRLAPVQAASWGHPVTSGLPTVDYYLSATAFEPEDADQHYSERLVRLPNFGVYCEAPEPLAREFAESGGGAPCGPGPGARGSRDAGPILVCAGTPYKYAPEHDAVLVDIAQRLGRCQFHFFQHRDGSLSRRLLERVGSAFAAAGLDASRYFVLRPWASPPEFHDFLRSADLFLDTIGFSGFNTVMRAAECGLPIVTCRGRFLRGRLGSGILQLLSLTECIAETPQAYVDVAVSLAENPAARRRIREQLWARLPGVYEDRTAIECLERFFLGVL